MYAALPQTQEGVSLARVLVRVHEVSHSPSPVAGSGAALNPPASSATPDLLAEAEARCADTTVQQCLDLCSNVDLIYKLLIQEVQPVLSKLRSLLPVCKSTC